jgi:hypothetical protein
MLEIEPERCFSLSLTFDAPVLVCPRLPSLFFRQVAATACLTSVADGQVGRPTTSKSVLVTWNRFFWYALNLNHPDAQHGVFAAVWWFLLDAGIFRVELVLIPTAGGCLSQDGQEPRWKKNLGCVTLLKHVSLLPLQVLLLESAGMSIFRNMINRNYRKRREVIDDVSYSWKEAPRILLQYV